MAIVCLGELYLGSIYRLERARQIIRNPMIMFLMRLLRSCLGGRSISFEVYDKLNIRYYFNCFN
jgi:hypothetical protein